VPPEVAQALHEWPLPGRDYNNSRYTQDSPVDSSTVRQLEEAWRVRLPGFSIAYGKISTVPLILGGTVYIEDLSSSVRAIDLKTGAVKWAVEADSLNPGPNGVAVGWGKVFGIRGSDTVVAYDAASGDELWVKRVVDTATAGIDIQPIVFEGLVLVSTVPISTNGIYTGGDRGILKALDQQTGEERWRFDTIESKDDVWGNSRVNSGGGSWYPPSIDLASGRIFWAVANPAPFPGTPDFPNGSSRPGPNLYTDSTLVLDAKTGSYQWHHQTIQHDIFDRDLLHTMLTEVAGIPIVVSTGKEGRVWANRRDNGEVLWGPVPVGMHMNDDLTELTDETQVMPGSFGGVLTPPALAEGVVYVATLNAPTTYSSNQTAYFGSEIGTNKGNLTAIDVTSGNKLWDVQIDGDPTGGVTVVNDLVFTATFQGEVTAHERATGKEVWSWMAPGGINSWMSVAGDTLIVPVGAANPAVVVALRLSSSTGGPTMPPGSAGAGGGTAGSSAPSATPNAFSAIYPEILASRCAGPVCHGNASTGGSLIVSGTNASAARTSLLNRAASGSECSSSGLSLVVPGQPDQSLLYRKLMDMPPCGSRMPPTGPLPPGEIDRIRTWIANGAAND
jgi:alcohol dehydrogenase (cytochrome c)